MIVFKAADLEEATAGGTDNLLSVLRSNERALSKRRVSVPLLPLVACGDPDNKLSGLPALGRSGSQEAPTPLFRQQHGLISRSI
jgi:hypothetical protein